MQPCESTLMSKVKRRPPKLLGEAGIIPIHILLFHLDIEIYSTIFADQYFFVLILYILLIEIELSILQNYISN